MRLSTFKRNWMLHYIEPEYLYLPRASKEKPEPIPTSWDYRIIIDFLFTEEQENQYNIPLSVHAKPIFCLKKQNAFIFFELYKTERKTLYVNGVYGSWNFLFFNPVEYKNKDIEQNIIPVNTNYTLNLAPNGHQKYIFCFDKQYNIELYDFKAEYAKIHENVIPFEELKKVDSTSLRQDMETTFITYYPAYCDITLQDIFEVKRPPNKYSIETVSDPSTEANLGFLESLYTLGDGLGNIALFNNRSVIEDIWRNGLDFEQSYYFRNLAYKNNMHIAIGKLNINVIQKYIESTLSDLHYNNEISLEDKKFDYYGTEQLPGSPLYAEESWEQFDAPRSFELLEGESGKQKAIGHRNQNITIGTYAGMSSSSFSISLNGQLINIQHNFIQSLYQNVGEDYGESKSRLEGHGVTFSLPGTLSPTGTVEPYMYHNFPELEMYPMGKRWPTHQDTWTPVGPEYDDHNPRPYDPYAGMIDTTLGGAYDIYYENNLPTNKTSYKRDFNSNINYARAISSNDTIAYYSGKSVSFQSTLYSTTGYFTPYHAAYSAAKIIMGPIFPQYEEWTYLQRGYYREETSHTPFSGGFLYPNLSIRLVLIELLHSAYDNYNEKNNTIIFKTPTQNPNNISPYINKIYQNGNIDTLLSSKTMYDTDEVIFRHYVDTERNSLRLQDFL